VGEIWVVRWSVGFVTEGANVEECEEHHLEGLQDGTQTGIYIVCGHIWCILDNAKHAESRQKSRLPECQEHNSLDSKKFEKWFMRR
jgi:hypothetical protein